MKDRPYNIEEFSVLDKKDMYKEITKYYKTEREEILKKGEITIKGQTMKFCYCFYGKKPETGFSLFIGLHGGGGCPKQINDLQYENHKRLYKNVTGIWFTPRSPEDVWNMWHKDYMDEMLDFIIQSFLILELIDSNRVYLTGYSAGGDGVYKLGPRMADRFAGCAMMGGHPNGAEMDSMRNCFMALQVGGKDTAYNRHKVCAEYGEKFRILKENDCKGYDHFVKVHDQHGHWMCYDDAIAFDILKEKVRDPLPNKIVWKQCNDVLKNHFYWLEVPIEKAKYGGLIVAEKKGNRITITTSDYDEVIVNVNDKMFNNICALEIKFNDSEVFFINLCEDLHTLVNSIERKFDPNLIFGTSLSCSKRGVHQLRAKI